ncbi:PepSY-associated TM helix domain-containing protein [Ferrimonas aestuarii]|uniref:PepSY domain-containing protein n=1 Tax=Ferrimonas aestuarii TaxID=2569539 RepID=A0A4V5NYG6_9GAMM|nr:PepSY-associated TM helix domain-containing protein [Ferrimonas aestuarii]TKB58708.1 PepSY domain-containing protein [Ferrimonas aestuarii]
MSRRLWTRVHTLSGMGACLLLSFVLITGTFATISNEIDWLANPAIRAQHSVTPNYLPWPEFAKQANQHYPESTLLQLLAPFDHQFNAQAVLRNPQGERFRVYLDPKSGQITGEGRWLNWQRFFRLTHRHLMMPTQYGVPIVSATAFLLLALLISGLVIYKGWYKGWLHWPTKAKTPLSELPKPKQAAQRVRRSYRYWGDWHRLLGLWSLPFVLLMVITGIWYFIESLGGRADYPQLPQLTEIEHTSAPVEAANLTTMLAQIAQRQPEFQVKRIVWPTSAERPLVIQGQAQTWLVRDRANHFAFDPTSGALLQRRQPQDLSLHARISEAADPLHFGWLKGSEGFSWARWLWCVFGIMLSTLSISGCHLFATKAFMREPQQLTAKSWFYTCFSQMGPLKWPCAALIPYLIVASVYLFL